MNAKQLFIEIGLIDDKYINEAQPEPDMPVEQESSITEILPTAYTTASPKRNSRRNVHKSKKFVIIAAILVLLLSSMVVVVAMIKTKEKYIPVQIRSKEYISILTALEENDIPNILPETFFTDYHPPIMAEAAMLPITVDYIPGNGMITALMNFMVSDRNNDNDRYISGAIGYDSIRQKNFDKSVENMYSDTYKNANGDVFKMKTFEVLSNAVVNMETHEVTTSAAEPAFVKQTVALLTEGEYFFVLTFSHHSEEEIYRILDEISAEPFKEASKKITDTQEFQEYDSISEALNQQSITTLSITDFGPEVIAVSKVSYGGATILGDVSIKQMDTKYNIYNGGSFTLSVSLIDEQENKVEFSGAHMKDVEEYYNINQETFYISTYDNYISVLLCEPQQSISIKFENCTREQINKVLDCISLN